VRVAIIFLAFLLASCSLEKRAQRLMDKGYSFVDTAYIETTQVDTFTLVQNDTTLLKQIDSVLVYLADTCKDIIVTEIIPIIQNSTPVCIEDTLVHTEFIANDSLYLELSVKAFQSGDTIYLSAILDNARIYYSTLEITPEKRKSVWYLYVIIGLLTLLLIGKILR